MKHCMVLIMLLLVGSSLPAEPRHRIADKKFWLTVGVLATSAFVDGYTTHRCVVSRSCIENNPLFGRRPSYSRILLEGGGFVAAESAALFYVKRFSRDQKAWALRNFWWMAASAGSAGHAVAAFQNTRNFRADLSQVR